ncbi:MAG TPA: hypothetical protein VG722_10075 [Tepidisphaeraceae bacterium]|nr:hypothetical protein [Tepidisphaeraceae bacterium]
MKRVAIIFGLVLSGMAWAQVASTQPADGGPQPSTPILREGSYLVDRVGRLGHTADSQRPIFIFDPGDSPHGESSIAILPNLNLMLMENAVASDTHDIHFKITGMVTEYRGKNYVLLEKVLVVPEER